MGNEKETRVEKYKEYRASLIRADDKVFNSHEQTKKYEDTLSGTRTLPIDEVYQNLDSSNATEEELLRLKKRTARISLISIIIGIVLAITLIVLLLVLILK